MQCVTVCYRVALLIECRALSYVAVENRALSAEYKALLIQSMFVSVEHRAFIV